MNTTPQVAVATQARLVTVPFLRLAACALLFFLAVGMSIPLLPRLIVDELHGGSLAVGMIVGAVAVSSLGIRPWAGRLGDAWGRRGLVLIGTAAGAASFAAYAIAPDLWTLALSRLITGLGMALFFIGALTLVTDLSPEDRRGEAVSYFSLAPWLGISVGPAIGELVARVVDDRAAFVVAGALVAIGLLPALGVRDVEHVESNDDGPAPRIHPHAVGPGAVLALGLFGVVAFSAFLPLYSRQIGLSGVQWVFLAYGAVILLIRLGGGRIPDRFGAGPVGTIATLLIAAGLAIVAAFPSAVAVYLGTVLFAVGVGLQYPALMALTLGRVPASERASAISTFTISFDLAHGVGGATLGLAAALGSYRVAFGGGAVCALLALLLLRTCVVRSRPQR